MLMHTRHSMEDYEFKIDKIYLEQISEDLDTQGKLSNAVFENLMRNNFVKGDVLRELAQLNPDKDDTKSATAYSGHTFVH